MIEEQQKEIKLNIQGMIENQIIQEAQQGKIEER